MRSRVFEKVLGDSLKNFEISYKVVEEFGTLLNTQRSKKRWWDGVRFKYQQSTLAI